MTKKKLYLYGGLAIAAALIVRKMNKIGVPASGAEGLQVGGIFQPQNFIDSFLSPEVIRDDLQDNGFDLHMSSPSSVSQMIDPFDLSGDWSTGLFDIAGETKVQVKPIASGQASGGQTIQDKLIFGTEPAYQGLPSGVSLNGSFV